MTTTPNLGLTYPTVGASDDTWGTENNAVITGVDACFKADGTGTSVGVKVGSGKTLNALDGTVVLGDAGLTLKDTADPTKIAAFQCSGITAGQTRTYTLPDASGTLLYSGGALGTPASGDLSNCTGAGVSQTTGNFGTLPTITGTGSNPTISFTTQTAKYVKTGKTVTNEVELVINTASGGSGSTEITNAVSDAPLTDVSCTIGYFNAPGGISSSYQMLSLVILAGTTTGLLYGYNLGAGTSGRITNSNLAAAGNAITYSCTYQIP